MMTLGSVPLRMLTRFGAPVTLRRRVGTTGSFVDATALGVLRAYRPEQLTEGLKQGDARLIVDAVAAQAGGFDPPKKGDLAVLDGHTYTVQGCNQRDVGGNTATFEIWVRG